MRGDIFIVRSDADQEWHVRLAAAQSDQRLSASEQLERKLTAEENVLAQARCFGFDTPRLVHLSSTREGPDDSALLYSGLTINGKPLERELVLTTVHYVDEREGVTE